MNTPFHLFAFFQNREQFLENYMHPAPCGGVFVNIAEGDKEELLGSIAELRVRIDHPAIQINFRGIIISVHETGETGIQKKLGIEFFRYEAKKNHYLLDQLDQFNRLPGQMPPAFIDLRVKPRLPAHLRLQFHCSHESENNLALAKPGSRIAVVTRTQEISTTGCSFHSVRFLKPGSRLQVSLYPQLEISSPINPKILNLSSTVRWNDMVNFNHRLMGLEFDFTDSATTSQKPLLHKMIAHVQKNFEAEYFLQKTNSFR